MTVKEEDAMNIEDAVKMSYRELQGEAKKRGLKATGTTEELIERLCSNDSPGTENTPKVHKDSAERQTFAGRVRSKDGGWKFSRR